MEKQKETILIVIVILAVAIFGIFAYSWIIDQTNKLPIQFNPESTVDPNETEYEECIRVWNDTIGLELLKKDNKTVQEQCA